MEGKWRGPESRPLCAVDLCRVGRGGCDRAGDTSAAMSLGTGWYWRALGVVSMPQSQLQPQGGALHTLLSNL